MERAILLLLYAMSIHVMYGVAMTMPLCQTAYLMLGVLIGSIIDFVWWRRFAFSKYDLSLEVLEHYHWSYILSTIAVALSHSIISTILIGIALVLLIDEAAYQKHPFAIGSSHFVESTIIGLILFFIHVVVVATT